MSSFRSVLAAGAILGAVACSTPEDQKATATPSPSSLVPLTVNVALAGDVSAEAREWAGALEQSIGTRPDDLELVPDPAYAQLVVRIASVEAAPEGAEIPGEGKAVVMRGALVVGDRTRDFNLSYRGEARAQTQALARNLRRLADETRQQAAATPEPSQ